MANQVLDGIMGVCVADALGLPVEFLDRDVLESHPVQGMRGYGTFHQPAGTWSDDTSLTICLADSLLQGLDYFDIMNHFRKWMFQGEYTPFGTAFDIGNGTAKAIFHYDQGKDPLSCGGTTEGDNGNGSLMRILPLLFYIRSVFGKDWFGRDEAMTVIHNVSRLTHGHKRSWIACGLYLSVADLILEGNELAASIHSGITRAIEYYAECDGFKNSLCVYTRVQQESFAALPSGQIRSSGYVVDTLEAAVWCLLNSDSYSSCVLRAVNLGADTDTVAAVAGGLAGLYYGYDSIPGEWLSVIARREYVEDICIRLNRVCSEEIRSVSLHV